MSILSPSQPSPDTHCEWCGRKFYVAKARRTVARFCSPACQAQWQKGRSAPNARHDEKLVHEAGYLLVWAPDHPHARNGRVREHRLVMEQKLGRYLESDEIVHHKDGDPKNNHPDNLELTTSSGHGKLHGEETRHRCCTQVVVTCPECGSEFSVKRSHAARRKYCSQACYKPHLVQRLHPPRGR